MEYPKALYLAGQPLVVDNAEQEAGARADGYDDWHADHERGTRPANEDAQPRDRDALKARAKELGITHAKNIDTDKLATLVAEAEGA